MRKRTEQIGFSQRVRLEWLEQTANLVLAGNGAAAVTHALDEMLKHKVSVGSTSKRSTRNKIISILRKIWVTTPEYLIPLRRDALAFLSTDSSSFKTCALGVVLQWGMAMAVYPFWGRVATQTGRLLRLQGSVRVAQVQRRLFEQYGERETVSRAVGRVLRSYVDWGVLKDGGTRGIYLAGIQVGVEDPRLIAWLAEAFLRAQAKALAPLNEVIHSPSFFPFRIQAVGAQSLVAASPRLDLLRHGLDNDVVVLRKESQPTMKAVVQERTTANRKKESRRRPTKK